MKGNIFIVGVGRSGTTLLQSMLHAHSKIYFPPETHFVKRYLIPEIKGSKIEDISESILISDLTAKEEGELDGIALEEFRRILQEPTREYRIADAYNSLNSLNGIEYIGDKDPMNINFLPEIQGSFDNPYFIHIIRDPRDVITSRMKSEWGKKHGLVWHTAEYKFSLNKALKDKRQIKTNRYMELKYESLLENPESILKEVCAFLELEFENRMLDHRDSAGSLIKENELSWKSNALKPIDKGNVGKWKKTLSNTEVIKIETLLKKEFDLLSFSVSNLPKRSLFAWTRFKAYFIGLLFKAKFR